jgi:hypothetical protein
MNKVVLTLVFLMSLGILMSFNNKTEKKVNLELINVSNYCKGWEDGYCEGWKDVKGEYTICPITPLCPLPKIGKDNYKGGYNRGFKAGIKAARKN